MILNITDTQHYHTLPASVYLYHSMDFNKEGKWIYQMILVFRRLVIFVFVDFLRLGRLGGALLAHVEQDLAVPVRRKLVAFKIQDRFLDR